jgi:hypothetical protein
MDWYVFAKRWQQKYNEAAAPGARAFLTALSETCVESVDEVESPALEILSAVCELAEYLAAQTPSTSYLDEVQWEKWLQQVAADCRQEDREPGVNAGCTWMEYLEACSRWCDGILRKGALWQVVSPHNVPLGMGTGAKLALPQVLGPVAQLLTLLAAWHGEPVGIAGDALPTPPPPPVDPDAEYPWSWGGGWVRRS